MSNTQESTQTHRGWSIELDPALGIIWIATGPNYDASYEGAEEGWISNGEYVTASTRENLIREIDEYIEEHS